MMTREGLRRHNCCPGHNPRSYDHGRERAREEREWLQDVAELAPQLRGPAYLPRPATPAAAAVMAEAWPPAPLELAPDVTTGG
ncbi:hypothetical protein [Streptomyces nanshensis]|uniref:Uncharacterized protein n=1 Tax=Streptomyces nanshensis TaxID=518642 RepID=A0A1E7LC93_9ACTN|nr:hypothetical protein [Streptomyces nanshensis]OEV13788.1 hypothetical protein AN218_01765 [Streptomyces nanshensis]